MGPKAIGNGFIVSQVLFQGYFPVVRIDRGLGLRAKYLRCRNYCPLQVELSMYSAFWSNLQSDYGSSVFNDLNTVVSNILVSFVVEIMFGDGDEKVRKRNDKIPNFGKFYQKLVEILIK